MDQFPRALADSLAAIHFLKFEIQEFMLLLSFAVLQQRQHAYPVHLFLFRLRMDDLFERRQYIPE